ncbi:DUF2206 domain-containing protein [Thermococcus henrietii]|uniref:DUF2206 domain-containing protein n=1 Tax=Thermococcus henrietii TaxID=2016361 RepID=UPI000C07FF01|nr:DUF2206 domain-containing protein [Thermococcus henrietii]
MSKRKEIIITISILLGLNSSIIAGYLGIHIPLARYVFGFLVLTFLPGYLLLAISGATFDSFSERVFMSVALSISVIMLVGIFANFVYPLLGVDKPITLWSILVTINLIILSLVMMYKKIGFSVSDNYTNKKIVLSKLDFPFILLPIWSLLGAYRFSHYGDNKGLLFLYLVISFTPILFFRYKTFNKTFAIWSIAISLIWSTTFGVSWGYIWGYDINGEYHYANLVLSSGIWNISTYYQYNTIASDNILAPVYSLILSVNIIWIFKIIYPLFLSLVPVILLKAYEKLLKNKMLAEFSVLFFVFLSTFFTELVQLARQMIAELYLALLVYMLITRVNKTFVLLFLISLAVSHYGTAYLVMFAFLFISFLKAFSPNIKQKFSNTLVMVFSVVTILWYSYAGRGVQFTNLTLIGYQTLIMLKNIFNPQYSQGLELIVSKTTLGWEIAKWVNIIAQIMIMIGIMKTVYNAKDNKKYLEFYILSFVFFLYDIAGIVVPYFSNRLNATRLYQITLFFLSPYFTIGITTLITLLRKILPFKKIGTIEKKATRVIAIFLVIYFLSNSGIIVVALHDPHPPIWLEKINGPYWDSSEIYGGKWLVIHKGNNMKIYSDQDHALIFLGLIGQPISGVSFRGNLNEDIILNLPNKDAYLYFGSIEVVRKKVPVQVWFGSISKVKYVSLYNPTLFRYLLNSQKIYASNSVWIYKV